MTNQSVESLKQYIKTRVDEIHDQQDDLGTIDDLDDRLEARELDGRRHELQKLLREMDRNDW